ncbi:MAG: hypothetical protein EAZ30_11055 [Betaproteobacteria bacterium]|nr:MAG: hypothetical protein EAZ30_11055 [Betaproteobacteria bacterium]
MGMASMALPEPFMVRQAHHERGWRRHQWLSPSRSWFDQLTTNGDGDGINGSPRAVYGSTSSPRTGEGEPHNSMVFTISVNGQRITSNIDGLTPTLSKISGYVTDWGLLLERHVKRMAQPRKKFFLKTNYLL